MKKLCKQILSLVLSLIMVISVLPLAGLNLGINAEAKTISDYSSGDIIEFGSYPQTEVTDTSLISSLNSLSKTWVSYGYYTGTGSYSDGKMTSGDWMKYADVSYGGNKYRAVTFNQYRPYYTGYTSSASNSYQDENGYYTNTVYYFKYEPLKWRVLDPEEGLVMCESIIDSQAYSNTIYYKSSYYYNSTSCTNYANDYATSSIREWLNDDFYNTAFTSAEKAEIGTTTLDNSCWSSSYPEFDSATTNDKIFLLSYDEVLNTDYGFSSSYSTYDTARRAKGTDYAKCQGLWVLTSSSYYGNSYWRLRSPDYNSIYACEVYNDGNVYGSYYVGYTSYGIRPALKFNPKSEISKSEKVQFIITPDRTKAEPGDIINYTVAMKWSDYVSSFQFDITLPDEMTFVNGSGKLLSDTESLMKLEGYTFDEVSFDGAYSVAGYTSSPSTLPEGYDSVVLVEFQAKVNNDVTIGKTLELALDQVSSADENFEKITAVGFVNSETVTIYDHLCTPGEQVIENTVEAKCEKEGSYDIAVYCIECGKEISRETITISALGHDLSVLETPPTDSELGYVTYSCKNCDYTYVVMITGYEVNGTITSFRNKDKVITLTLTLKGETEPAYTTKVTGNSAEFSFGIVAIGEYTMAVSKENHATRTYDISVAKNTVTVDAKIHLIGDITGDGKVNTIDVARMNAHARGVTRLENYDFICADISNDGKVNTIDVSRANAHARGVLSLW